MSSFESIAPTPQQRKSDREDVLVVLEKIGAAVSDDFQCNGMPMIALNDTTQTGDFDFAPLAGCIVLGGRMNSVDVSPFPSGLVRLSIVRWGEGDDKCGKIIVGKGTDLDGTSIVSYVGVTIGENVYIGPRTVIMDCDGHPGDRTLPDIPENRKKAPIVIGDNVKIGFGSMIMKGVTIGEGAVIAPKSVVMWDVPAGAYFGGNPAKKVRAPK